MSKMRSKVKDANGLRYKDIKVYKYITTKDYLVELPELKGASFESVKFGTTEDDTLVILKGYKSDGASGIAIASSGWRIASEWPTPRGIARPWPR